MTISETKIYPRTGDKQTVYLKSVVKNPNIIVGDYTMYNDFVNAPTDFEKKQCFVSLSNQSRQTNYWKVLLYCVWCEVYFHKC